eukprot:jgi/Pico_ML_1/51090/g2178.t1
MARTEGKKTCFCAWKLLETKVCKGAVRDWYQPGNLSWDRSYDKFLDQHVNTIALVKDVLVEVNAHSLFSKWFSESGKLVSKLFSKIQEILEDEDTLVFVLIDEVESHICKAIGIAGSEPSDAIRVVNALLTQLDALKYFTNSMTLTTSNITEAVDGAFLDRADIKAYIEILQREPGHGALKSRPDRIHQSFA